MQRQLIFQLPNLCKKHRNELQFICTFPCCSQIQLCSQCQKQHSAIHASAYIQTKSNWLHQMERDIDTLSQFTKQINLNNVSEDIQKSLSISKSAKNKSQNLAILVQNVMKCITDERNFFCQRMEQKLKVLNDQNYKKIDERKLLLKYFCELQSSKSFQLVFFLLNQKGWIKMKKRLRELNFLAVDCKAYIDKAGQVIKQFQDIAEKLRKHQSIEQLAFLQNVERLICSMQSQIKAQQDKKQRKVVQKNEHFPANEIKLFKAPPKQQNVIRQNQKLQFRGKQDESPRRKRAKTIFGQKKRQ